jgi:hypothetical protein
MSDHVINTTLNLMIQCRSIQISPRIRSHIIFTRVSKTVVFEQSGSNFNCTETSGSGDVRYVSGRSRLLDFGVGITNLRPHIELDKVGGSSPPEGVYSFSRPLLLVGACSFLFFCYSK